MRNEIAFFLICICITIPLDNVAQSWQNYSDSAKLFKDKGQSAQAITYYGKARDLVKKDSALSNTFIQLTNNIAGIHFRESRYKLAAAMFEESRVAGEKLSGKNATYASILNSLAASYNSAGEYNKAEQYYLEAKDLRLNLLSDQHPDYAQSSNNLGFFYWSVGDYEKAEPLILVAKAIREKLPPLKQSPLYAITCTNLANLYRDMGQFEKAEALYKEAKDIRALIEPVRRNPAYANACNILADLYNLSGQHQKAELLYLEAKDIRSVNKNSLDYSESCNNLFALYRDMGQYEKAEPLALEAKAIYEALSSTGDPSFAININNLGELYYKMGELKKAETYFLQARSTWEKALGRSHPYYLSNSNALARLYWSMGETAKANELYTTAANAEFDRIRSVFQFTSEREKSAYLKNISGSADEYFSFYYKELNKEDASQPLLVSLRNRNLILSSTQRLRSIIYNSSDTSLHTKFEDWSNSKQALGRMYAILDASDERLIALEERTNLLEKDLSRNSSSFKQAQQSVIDWQLLQNTLKPGEAAIEFIVFQYHDGKRWTDSTFYEAIVLRKDKQPVMINLFEKKQLEQITMHKEFKDLYAFQQEEPGSATNTKQIYDLVWKPLEKALGSAHKIYFAPAGRLHQIAFAAIPVSATQVLSDRYNMEQLNSIYAITQDAKGQIRPGDKLNLYGGIKYEADSSINRPFTVMNTSAAPSNPVIAANATRGNTWTFLPGTQEEVSQIKKLAGIRKYKVDLTAGVDATEASVKQLHGKTSPAVLHIATHGFFFPDPKDDKRSDFQKSFDKSGTVFKSSDDPLMRSGLLFAGANNAWQGKGNGGTEDGILTSYEVSGLHLPNTRLVVLSACETALGDVQGSEGVYGLQRAFKMAGVQHLVMSLWKVPDHETAEFMQHFYKNYFNGLSVNEAFKGAQASMKNKYRNDPFKWAAWVLIR